MLDKQKKILEETIERINKIKENQALQQNGKAFLKQSIAAKYSYNFTWLGRPIIQYPQDIVALQEIIWQVEPDLIIETGIAHGGSIIFSASQLALLDLCNFFKNGENQFECNNIQRKILAIDIDIRQHNLQAINNHPLSRYITMIEGSSIDQAVIEQVYSISKKYKNILLILDSNHTHQHVLAELNAYAKLCSIGSYCVVFDTIIEDLSPELIGDRPWGQGNSPATAISEFLSTSDDFVIDHLLSEKLVISVANRGYLQRIK